VWKGINGSILYPAWSDPRSIPASPMRGRHKRRAVKIHILFETGGRFPITPFFVISDKQLALTIKRLIQAEQQENRLLAGCSTQ